MGGDNFPDALVEGGIAALRIYPDVEVHLVGDERLVGDCVGRILEAGKGNKNSGELEALVRDRLSFDFNRVSSSAVPVTGIQTNFIANGQAASTDANNRTNSTTTPRRISCLSAIAVRRCCCPPCSPRP